MRKKHSFKLAIAAAVMIGGVGLSASVASAAQPAQHACVGSSLSALATNQQSPGSFGQAVRSFAQQPGTSHPGLGDGIQQLQAGQVPDEVVPNTCN